MADGRTRIYTGLRFENPKDQIRLLWIKPAAQNDPDGMIECRLGVHDLFQVKNRYCAISYTWGSERPTKRIMINGRKRTVRWNCWYALLQMRARNRRTLYWIDSICIDQGNHHEKVQQIRNMRLIYAWAGEVAISLEKFRFRGKLSQEQDCETTEGKWRWDGLHSFACHPFFQRLWVLQECLLAAPGALTVYAGCQSRSWVWLETKFDTLTTPWRPGSSFSRLADLMADRKNRNERPDPDDLWELVFRYSARLCRNPRDKVFGLLGLCLLEQADKIVVDYGTPLLNLLLNVASLFRPEKNDLSMEVADPEKRGLCGNPINLLIVEFAAACDEFIRDIGHFFRDHYHNHALVGTGGEPDKSPRGSSYLCPCRISRHTIRRWMKHIQTEGEDAACRPSTTCGVVIVSVLHCLDQNALSPPANHPLRDIMQVVDDPLRPTPAYFAEQARLEFVKRADRRREQKLRDLDEANRWGIFSSSVKTVEDDPETSNVDSRTASSTSTLELPKRPYWHESRTTLRKTSDRDGTRKFTAKLEEKVWYERRRGESGPSAGTIGDRLSRHVMDT